MKWPQEIISAFADALAIDFHNGTPKEEIIAAMLDAATRRAVWRVGGDHLRAAKAMRTPYTPLSSVVGDGLDGRVESFTIKGDRWRPAVQAYFTYVENNAAAIFDFFRGAEEEYDDSV